MKKIAVAGGIGQWQAVAAFDDIRPFGKAAGRGARVDQIHLEKNGDIVFPSVPEIFIHSGIAAYFPLRVQIKRIQAISALAPALQSDDLIGHVLAFEQLIDLLGLLQGSHGQKCLKQDLVLFDSHKKIQYKGHPLHVLNSIAKSSALKQIGPVGACHAAVICQLAA